MEKAEGEAKIPAYLEGPYGHGCSLDHFEQVLLVCGEYTWPNQYSLTLTLVAFTGGSGITFGTSNLIAIVDAARRGESAVRRVKLVWMVRDKGEGCIYLALLSNTTNLSYFWSVPAHWEWVRPLVSPILASLPESIIVELELHVTASMPVEPNLTAEEAADETTVPAALYESASGVNSGRSSQDDMAEKLEEPKEKMSPDSDSEVDSSAITWHSGRADIHTILHNMVSIATGPVSVNGMFSSSTRDLFRD